MSESDVQRAQTLLTLEELEALKSKAGTKSTKNALRVAVSVYLLPNVQPKMM